ELQGYFMSRIKKFVNSRGRKIIGWDEILKGHLDSSATVMSWRGVKGGIAAAKRGNDVIMSPNDPLYFNRVQAEPEGEPYAPDFSINTLQRVYNYDPIPGELTPVEQHHILGGQFALWTEFISSASHLEYMLLPRMPAAAESFWSPSGQKDFDDFVRRLNDGHFEGWEQQ